MTATRPAKLVEDVCRFDPGLDPQGVEEFLSGMDEGYVAGQAPGDVALHVRMSASLDPTATAVVRVVPRPEGTFDVVVVAYDYFAEFSLLCGLLAAHGLAIESGRVHTLAAPPRPPEPRRRRTGHGSAAPSRKIVDVFRVAPGRSGGAPDGPLLEGELRALLELLAQGRTDEARETLNRRLVGSLARSGASFVGTLSPIDITFHDDASAAWTVMRVRGRDTPGFLYSVANALAMRRIYVHGVRIESEGAEVRDEFLIGHAAGGRLESEGERQTLRLAVALIKQFTHFLPWAPDPARALQHFDQFLDRVMAAGAGSEALKLLRGPDGFTPLARVLGSSDFLWEDFLRAHFEQLIPALQEWPSRPLGSGERLRVRLRARLESARSAEARVRALNQFKDEEIFAADVKRLLDPGVCLEDFSATLTELAEAVLGEAFHLGSEPLEAEHGLPRLADGAPCPVSLIGLGKFGGREMGYASDLELMVVYGGPGATEKSGIENGQFFERVAQALPSIIESRDEGIFHVDLRLRPHGNKGPLATPFPAMKEYYRSGTDAHPFERQALIKLRRVGGDEDLGGAVEAFRDSYVWSGEPWDLNAALHLRDRQVRELVTLGRFNVKYSPGGLVEVEYATQYLQIQNGQDHPEVRSPSTREALDGLVDAGALSPAEHRDLTKAYAFWRNVVDALRMVRGNARDLLLPEDGSFELAFLARRMGYTGSDWSAAAEEMSRDAARHRDAVSRFFTTRFRG
jgi:[glutamine synthetase] adenylyltransferase / [glutamine synthetase]-adenylyl-L-tyrosine phosphorylase